MSDVSGAADTPERLIARRRWRNMMIAALAGHKISQERRDYLEKMRQQLGVSVEEARAVVDEYRHSGGGITLFGDKFQRLQVFRDLISMLLVEGEIDGKGRELLTRIAARLDIDKSKLEDYIREGQAALQLEQTGGLVPGASRDSQRLSRRIFRRMVSENQDRDTLLKEFDSLDREHRRELELKILENIVHESSKKGDTDESVRTRRQRLAYLEDQRCSKILLEEGTVTEAQLRTFKERQEKLFSEEGRVISMITEMVKSGALDRAAVQAIRARVRAEHPEEAEEGWVKKTESEMGGLTVRFSRETLDQTFRASCLRLEGFLDHNTSLMLQEIFNQVFAGRDDSARLIILEMSGLSYISSAGVGEILNARAMTLDRWGDIRFVNVSPEAQEIFGLIGVDQVFTFCDNVTDALWSFTDLAIARES